jgi:glyoxylate reductase
VISTFHFQGFAFCFLLFLLSAMAGISAKISPRIVITRPLQGDPIAVLRRAGFDNIWINPRDVRLPRQELLWAIRGAHGVLATPADTLINQEFFDAAGPQLKIVSNYAVGVDNVDVAEARKRGVIVGYTPYVVTEPTADVAWLLLLGAARRASEGERLVRSGEWRGVGPNELLGHRVVGQTLFILGAGRIGYATARRAIGFQMRIIYHARTRHAQFEHPPVGAAYVALEEGLRQADFVSIHTPLNPSTRHLINAERLRLMKPSAILVNTSRGAVIDEAALVEALRGGGIAAAGLDVYENEPNLAPGLADLPNTFLLPHLGTATVDDRIAMMHMAVENVIAALRGERVPYEFQ